ncbi:hypothetical protein PTSG_11300 [Salpingoeca rosetta]|uniref:DNA repair metallo-beta-lactamase domain-containing protein n=1 Tax=Salpingoeca rosetta (strain ATCC 50818 / BSB-021) TaxID=946362 RepID=F2UT05_SALR5|nr:uncharacterized protein PTSG_11300 [Salpingoeca rosetta]EGD81264.1 hypothetical protein PTSG_11300 [Salpingoeca rosetta]|eukprot:XP_004987660.1 hypothetical protein PTSG_11300 [Salpingoeca rosetta]
MESLIGGECGSPVLFDDDDGDDSDVDNDVGGELGGIDACMQDMQQQQQRRQLAHDDRDSDDDFMLVLTQCTRAPNHMQAKDTAVDREHSDPSLQEEEEGGENDESHGGSGDAVQTLSRSCEGEESTDTTDASNVIVIDDDDDIDTDDDDDTDEAQQLQYIQQQQQYTQQQQQYTQQQQQLRHWDRQGPILPVRDSTMSSCFSMHHQRQRAGSDASDNDVEATVAALEQVWHIHAATAEGAADGVSTHRMASPVITSEAEPSTSAIATTPVVNNERHERGANSPRRKHPKTSASSLSASSSSSAPTAGATGAAPVKPHTNTAGRANAFDVLMRASKREAQQPLMRRGSSKESGSDASTHGLPRRLRQCPFYKWVKDTSFTVDAFSYGAIPNCTAYFLSHFHADHYTGLTKSFPAKVYCSEATARLCTLLLRVPPEKLNPLPMNTPVKVQGVTVELIDANHCPGAAVIVFTLPSGRRHVHTGDFRACEAIWQHTSIAGKRIHTVYLDTTYCDPRYTFPSQYAVLNFVANLAIKYLKRHPHLLVVVGSYTIGKEKVFLSIARALGCRVYASTRKQQIFGCLQDDALNEVLTDNPLEAQVHVTSMSTVNLDNLARYYREGYGFRKRFEHVLGFRPTGWTHSQKLPALSFIKPKTKRNITVYVFYFVLVLSSFYMFQGFGGVFNYGISTLFACAVAVFLSTGSK